MGIMYRAVRGAAKASKPHHHSQPKPKPRPAAAVAPRPPRPDPAAAAAHREDLAKLAELRDWAIAPRADRSTESVETEPERAVAIVADRPQAMDDMVGQEELRNQLAIVCAGTQLRGKEPPHFLIDGPAGFGKTTLAAIISNELGWHLETTTGMALRKPQDLAGLLMKAQPNTVLFIDEIHALSRPVMEVLYEVLEDAKLSTLVGSGAETVSYTHQMQGFVCVGATTRPGLLTTPFRDRFGFRGTMTAYSIDELALIVGNAWMRQGIGFTQPEAVAVAERCKGVPRRSLHLADRVLDYCAAHRLDRVEEGVAAEALEAFHVNAFGLDNTDYRILDALTGPFAGKTVGLDALSQFLDVDPKTLADEYEPFLAREGLVVRCKSGRMAGPPAYELMRTAAETSVSV